MRFDCNHGLFHLVFMNDSDVYYTPSLLRLNFKQYLYYELRQVGYKDIFFIDQALAAFEALDALSDMNKNAGAFVFSIQAFCTLKDHEEGISLLERLRKNNVSHHMILIYSPVTIDLIRDCFRESDSIFMNPRLFPRILRDVRLRGLTFYERMEKIFGLECVSCQNLLLRSDIDYMMKHLFLHKWAAKEQTHKDYFAAADDYVDFIWAWYHFPDFKRAVNVRLPDNQYRCLGVIESYMEDDGALEAVGQEIKRLRSWCEPGERLREMAARRFEPDTEPPVVYEKYQWFHRLAMQGCEAFGHMYEEPLKAIGQRLEETCMEGDLEWENFANDCLDYMQTAILTGDKDTFRRAVQAIGQDEGPDTGGMRQDLRRRHKEILAKSVMVFRNHKKIREYEKNIDVQGNELQAVMTQIEDFLPRDLKAVAKKERAILLSQNIKDMEKIVADLGRQTNALEKYIYSLELMTDTMDFKNVDFETMV